MSKIYKYIPLGNSYLNKQPSLLKRGRRCIRFGVRGALLSLLLSFVSAPKKKRYAVSICAIFKNEAQYLKEWICYHQLIGVEHFYLYNNFSDDNYEEVLAPFIDQGLVTLIDWKVMRGQNSAYAACVEEYSGESNWIAFIDIDEYICLKDDSSLAHWLSAYTKYPSVLLNWKMFGSSGLDRRDEDKLLIEQFTSSWECLTDVGKSIVNTSFKFEKCNHPHLFTSKKNGFRIPAVDQFKRFVFSWHFRPALLGKASAAQVNHYWSKSYQDFIYKETVRGDATSDEATEYRRLNVAARFIDHELMNTTKDYTIQRYVTPLRNKMAEYK